MKSSQQTFHLFFRPSHDPFRSPVPGTEDWASVVSMGSMMLVGRQK